MAAWSASVAPTMGSVTNAFGPSPPSTLSSDQGRDYYYYYYYYYYKGLPADLPTMPVTGVAIADPPPSQAAPVDFNTPSTSHEATATSTRNLTSSTTSAITSADNLTPSAAGIITSVESITTLQPTTFISSILSAGTTSSTVLISLAAPSSTIEPPTHYATTTVFIPPSETPTGNSNMTMATANKGAESLPHAAKLAAIIVPTLVVSFIILAVVGWWYNKRRRERKRADSVAKKALWTNQGFVDNIRDKMMCGDENKTHSSSPPGPHGSIGARIRPHQTPLRGCSNEVTTAIKTPTSYSPIGMAITKDSPPALRRLSMKIHTLNSLPLKPADLPRAPTGLDGPNLETSSSPDISSVSTVMINRSRGVRSETVAEAHADNSPAGTVIVNRPQGGYAETVPASDSPASTVIVTRPRVEPSESVAEVLTAWANANREIDSSQLSEKKPWPVDTYNSASSSEYSSEVDAHDTTNCQAEVNLSEKQLVPVDTHNRSSSSENGIELVREHQVSVPAPAHSRNNSIASIASRMSRRLSRVIRRRDAIDELRG